jgi:hypothetical protein
MKRKEPQFQKKLMWSAAATTPLFPELCKVLDKSGGKAASLPPRSK